MSTATPSSLLPQRGAQSRAELETLIRSRDELTSQLERVTEQRGELAQQRLNAEARANSSTEPALDRRLMREYEQQISELGSRAAQLRQQIAVTDEAIADATARGIATEAAEAGDAVRSTVISIPNEDFAAREALLHQRYQAMMVAEAAGLVLACVVIGRLLWKRAQRKATALFASASDVTGIKYAVDAIAVEVERISENQRYATRLLQERAEAIPNSAGDAKVPVEQRRHQGG